MVEDDPEGGYVARALGESIFTQADSIQELRELVKDAVHCHYPNEATRPKLIRLHLLLAFIKGHGLTTAALLH